MQDVNVPLYTRFAVPGQGMQSQLSGCHTGSCQLGLALLHRAFCSVLYELDTFCIMVLGLENARISGTDGTYLRLHSEDYTNSIGFRFAASLHTLRRILSPSQDIWLKVPPHLPGTALANTL